MCDIKALTNSLSWFISLEEEKYTTTGWVQGSPPEGFQASVRPSSIDATQIMLKAKQQLQHEKGGVKDLHKVTSGQQVRVPAAIMGCLCSLCLQWNHWRWWPPNSSVCTQSLFVSQSTPPALELTAACRLPVVPCVKLLMYEMHRLLLRCCWSAWTKRSSGS